MMQVAQKVPCDAEQEHTCAQEAARSQSGHRPRTAQQQTSSKGNETEASGAAVRDLRRLLACVRTRERRQDISEHRTKDECACPQRWATVDVWSDALLGRLADVAPNPPVSVSVLRELPKTDIAFERREVIAKLRVRQGRASE